ncbi:MAG: DUF3488 and DUF4129 domain-containing transglutaminase family protein, partial [Cyanobacteria bacterium P01_H01_bin.119]
MAASRFRLPQFRSWQQAVKRSQLAAQKMGPEESLLLRILVQALVTLGICSLAVAAAGVTRASWLNLVAIPLSALGAYVSWQRRSQRNIAIKFAIALGMLLALGMFFSRLIGQPGDTRIVLAELLVQLQVLHSYDLPRRKDLGYSMMIGLILLGVAATISQTLAFAPLLLMFLAIALPVLVLDYRSRLGLVASAWQIPAQLSWRRLGAMLGVTLALGLVIFAALPRLPGYQIRNFPVSGSLDFEGSFDNSLVINPGYVSGDSADEDGAGGGENGSGIQGSGSAAAQGPGQMDETFYYGFNQRINQNLRGELTPQVVMRVRSQAEGIWRVMAFDRYTGQGWEVSRNDEALTLNRSSLSYQILLPRIPWLNRDREIIQTYTLVSEMPNLIPALYRPRELYFPLTEIAFDAEGALRAPLPLTEGITYTVISEVPYRDRSILGQAGTDYPSPIESIYLQVPEDSRDRIRAQAEALLAKSPQPLTNPYEQALFLAQSLKQQYSLRPELPFFSEDDDLVEAFLFQYEGGYADHFSTALTIMLRTLGIPARLSVGFSPGEFNPFTGFYVVRNTDAFAMTEVFFPRYGWFAFDPIPGHPLIPPSIEDYQTFSTLRRFWNWVAGWLPSPLVGGINGILSWLGAQGIRIIAWVSGLLRRGWIGALVLLAIAVGFAFGLWLLWQGWGHWRRRYRLQQLPLPERLYQQMLTALAVQGVVKRPHQTPFEYLQTVQQQWTRHRKPQAQIKAVETITRAYVGWRYGDRAVDADILERNLRSLRRATARGQKN